MKKLPLLLSIILILNSCQMKSQKESDNSEATPQTDSLQTQTTKTDNVQENNGKIQVVFLLDATGSMSGLIGTAKEKIWSIVSGFTQTKQSTDIEIGLLFYRDRGDDFVTKLIPMGTNMDDLYEQLMHMQADGGGDTPESVNQALHESVTQISWDSQPDTYRAIFLVGDCPPHMDYNNDVKYPQSCKLAKEKDIIVNTILMGNDSEAKKIWMEIAQSTNGEFIQTDMSVNNIAITTPYDKKIGELQYELDNTRIYYGSEKDIAINETKKEQSSKIKDSDASISARRAEYNMSEKGKSSYYGINELISDVVNGKKLADIPKEQLPKEFQNMDATALNKYVNELINKRAELEKEITQLNKQRQEYIDSELEKLDEATVKSSFDDVIFDAVKTQAEEKNIVIDGKVKR